MTDRIEEIFQQVMDEDCSEPLRRFAELVRQDEREACAKLCESEGHRIDASWESCATAIRARSKHD